MAVYCVSINAVSRFISANGEFISVINSFENAFMEQTDLLLAEATRKQEKYADMVSRLQSLLDKAQSRAYAADRQASAAKSQAASVPATVPKTYTDANGNKATKEVANPEHAAAQAQANQAAQAARQAHALVEKVRSALSAYSQKVSQLSGMVTGIQRAATEQLPKIRQMAATAEAATTQAQAAKSAVEKYVSVSIKR